MSPDNGTSGRPAHRGTISPPGPRPVGGRGSRPRPLRRPRRGRSELMPRRSLPLLTGTRAGKLLPMRRITRPCATAADHASPTLRRRPSTRLRSAGRMSRSTVPDLRESRQPLLPISSRRRQPPGRLGLHHCTPRLHQHTPHVRLTLIEPSNMEASFDREGPILSTTSRMEIHHRRRIDSRSPM